MRKWPPQAAMAVAGLIGAVVLTAVGAWTTSSVRLDCVSRGDASMDCEQVAFRWFRLVPVSRSELRGVTQVTTASVAGSTYRTVGEVREERRVYAPALALLRDQDRLALLEGDPYSVEQARTSLQQLQTQGNSGRATVSVTALGKTWLVLGACLLGLQFYGWREALREWRRR